jgi:DNA-binding IclR family transcriptional regulator
MVEDRDTPGEDTAAPGEIQAVSRAAQILGLLGPEVPELTAAGTAELLDLNRTTAYRYCISLVAAGLLDRGGRPGTFIPGRLLLQLGTYALGRRAVMDLAPPHMRQLCADTHMTAVMSLWGSAGPVVSRVEEDTTRTVLITVRVGSHLDLESAQAKVFLAFNGDQFNADRLLAGLPAHQHHRLHEEIEQIRRTGRNVTANQNGVTAVAAPVFDEYGICAALAIIGTDDTLSPDPGSPQARLVVDTAADLTKEMGGAPPIS